MPEMTPVDVFKVNPLGNAGSTDQELTDPVTVGIFGVIATSIVYTTDVIE